ncbi:MAG: arginine--tRNA ligase, partial [Rhodospirillales bacterium]|nr:arginine--tRNA ligase [Rhodospirillales bacterium]
MNLFHHVREHLIGLLDGLVNDGSLPSGLSYDRLTVDPPREDGHGDLALNAAMVLAKPAGMKPRDLAQLILQPLAALEWVAEAEIAGPGFINLTLASSFWQARLGDILAAGKEYGSSAMGAGKKINVEYVSA